MQTSAVPIPAGLAEINESGVPIRDFLRRNSLGHEQDAVGRDGRSEGGQEGLQFGQVGEG
jgi:hypothetical protein